MQTRSMSQSLLLIGVLVGLVHEAGARGAAAGSTPVP